MNEEREARSANNFAPSWELLGGSGGGGWGLGEVGSVCGLGEVGWVVAWGRWVSWGPAGGRVGFSERRARLGHPVARRATPPAAA